MDALFSLGLSYTNYGLVNKINIYNFVLAIIDVYENDEVAIKRILKFIRIHIGITFYDGFLTYVRRKIPNHIILKL